MIFILQGCPRDYNEFVVYENRRAMIEYIISFQLDSKGDEELKTLSPSPFNGSKSNITDSKSLFIHTEQCCIRLSTLILTYKH